VRPGARSAGGPITSELCRKARHRADTYVLRLEQTKKWHCRKYAHRSGSRLWRKGHTNAFLTSGLRIGRTAAPLDAKIVRRVRGEGMGAVSAPDTVSKEGGETFMITPNECKDRADGCRQMAERAPNIRMRAILIDMARTWMRLALEAEQSNQNSVPLLRVIKSQPRPEQPRERPEQHVLPNVLRDAVSSYDQGMGGQ
jgi:hypothetical protein